MTTETDPPRLRSTSDDSDELAQALEFMRRQRPSPDAMERMTAKLAPLLRAPDETTLQVDRRPSVRVRAAGTAFAFKVLLAAVVMAAGLVTVVHFEREGRERDVAPHARAPLSAPFAPLARPAVEPEKVGAAPEASENSPSAAPPAVQANHAPAPSDRASSIPVPSSDVSPDAPVGATAFPDATTAMESSLLGQALRALGSDPGEALRLTDEHRSRFPSGLLTQEREVIAIQALVALGRRTEAEARADEFRRHFPNSGHLRRLDLLLGHAAP